MTTPSRPGRRLWVLVAVLAGVFCTAPVPGDIGGCGQTAQDLDPPTFFASKKAIDCRRCRECSIHSQSCTDACNAKKPIATSFPQYCYPLVHDGEVCLRALTTSSCNEYAGYMDDNAPSVPTECDFCPAGNGP